MSYIGSHIVKYTIGYWRCNLPSVCAKQNDSGHIIAETNAGTEQKGSLQLRDEYPSNLLKHMVKKIKRIWRVLSLNQHQFVRELNCTSKHPFTPSQSHLITHSSLHAKHLIGGLDLANLLASYPGLRPWSWAEHSS